MVEEAKLLPIPFSTNLSPEAVQKIGPQVLTGANQPVFYAMFRL